MLFSKNFCLKLTAAGLLRIFTGFPFKRFFKHTSSCKGKENFGTTAAQVSVYFVG